MPYPWGASVLFKFLKVIFFTSFYFVFSSFSFFSSSFFFSSFYSYFSFLSLSLSIGWHLSSCNCCKPLFPSLYNCQPLCFCPLALSTAVPVFPLPFSKYCSSKDVYFKFVMPNCMPYPWVASIFFLIFKSSLYSFALWKTSSLVILSVHLIFNILLQLHVSNALTILS